VTFSLAQFGDFFTDMALNINLSTTSCTAGTVPAIPVAPATVTAATALQTNGSITLGDGSVLQQINTSTNIIRNFAYLGTYQASGQ